MNTKSIHIDHSNHSSYSDLAAQPVSLIATAFKKASSFFFRSELEKAQANYRLKQNQQSPQQQDILSSMPVETKLGLGMYRLMD